MAILIEVHVDDMTVDDYLELVRRMGLSGPPKGAISHRAVETDYGVKVVDEWESEDEFNAFFGSIAEHFEDMDYEPQVEVFAIIQER
jgi:hypothetical protein